jgi:hypothetical protein
MLRRAWLVVIPLVLFTYVGIGQSALAARPGGGGGGGGGTTGGGGTPGFISPIVLPGSGGGNEPSLAISTGGIRYASWQGPGEFASSPNGTKWTNLGIPDDSASGDVTNAVDASGAVYNGQICGDAFILHTCIYRSTDGGKTWPLKTEPADSHPGASDRPWIDVYPKQSSTAWNPDNTTVYLEYHTFSPEELAYVTVSNDGGHTFSEPKFITTDTNAIVGSGCNTVPGGVTVDQRTGAVYALWLSGNDVESNLQTGCNYSQIGPFNKAWVSTSTDGGNTWTAHLAWEGAFDIVTKVGDNADKIFPTLAVDLGDQVQVAIPVRHNDDPVTFTATGNEDPQQTDLYLVTSPDLGAHWTAPFKLNAKTGSYFFPWTAAGSAGRVEIIYYRSDTLTPNDPNATWYIAFSAITNAVATVSGGTATYATPPTVKEIQLDKDPVHIGGICTFGLFCAAVPNANRNLADSIAIYLDPAGGANAVWTVDAPVQLSAGEDSHIEFACQSSGPSAFAGLPPLSGCYAAKAR